MGQRVRTREALIRALTQTIALILLARLYCHLRGMQVQNGRGRSGLGEPDERACVSFC